MISREFTLADESATQALAIGLAPYITPPCLFYLEGDLGTGKTFFVRSLLHALGYEDKVKSPTYTLVEPYQIKGTDYFHFDLYRVTDPEELELLGARDMLTQSTVSFIEWPEKGIGWLPAPDLRLVLSHHQGGRAAQLIAESAQGESILRQFLIIIGNNGDQNWPNP